MKEHFLDWKPNERSRELVDIANDIITGYEKDSIFSLSLRQLYYQFVVRNVFANTHRNYKNLGEVIKRGRLAGLIDWEAVVDLGRIRHALRHWMSAADRVASAAETHHIDLWVGQKYRLEVWIEKNAALSVIDDLCQRYDVPYMAHGGDTSVSVLGEMVRRIRLNRLEGYETVILYLGDHDPKGIKMNRIYQKKLRDLYGVPTLVDRILLNIDQTDGLVSQPVKPGDKVTPAYQAEFGSRCWEMDALDPTVLRQMLDDAILSYLDVPMFNKRVALLKRQQREIVKIARSMTMTKTKTKTKVK